MAMLAFVPVSSVAVVSKEEVVSNVAYIAFQSFAATDSMRNRCANVGILLLVYPKRLSES